MQEVITRKMEEGYFVRNSNLLKKAWNNTIGRVANEWVGGYKGGQCGEYGEWGIEWSKDSIQEMFGKEAVVTDIAIHNNRFLGHRATKVILPDGRRLVLDYWEGMPAGKAKIYTEEEWVRHWDDKLFSDYIGKAEVNQHDDQLHLKNLISQMGEEEGINWFRNYHARREQSGYAEIFIRSWHKNPW